MAAKTAARATATNINMTFGLLSFAVDIVSAVASKDAAAVTKTKLICPDCDTAHTVSQAYVCSEDDSHGPFTKATAGRGVIVDGVLKVASQELLDEQAKPAGEVADTNTVVVSVHRACEVEAHTMPSGNIYRLRPRAPLDQYGLVLALVGRSEGVAFVCEFTHKAVTKLYRLIARDGVLMLTELVRPEEFVPAEPVDVEVDERLLVQGRALVESMVDGFDPASFADRRRVRLEQLAGRVAPVADCPVGSVVDAAAGLMDLLARSVGDAAA